MNERIGLFEALYTNRAIRRFRPDPIPDSVISKIIEAATQAPNGSNQQWWRFLVIRDRGGRRRIGDVYRRAHGRACPPREGGKGHRLGPATSLGGSAGSGPAHRDRAPILILVYQVGSAIPPARPVDTLYATRSGGSSIYPAVQNLLLAARAYGLVAA
jgi:nitroreductase